MQNLRGTNQEHTEEECENSKDHLMPFLYASWDQGYAQAADDISHWVNHEKVADFCLV